MVEIEVQKACQGDCIWLRCVAEKSVNIVIDAGPSTYAKPGNTFDVVRSFLLYRNYADFCKEIRI